MAEGSFSYGQAVAVITAYGLTLNDTPFADERVIEQHIEAGISLCDAVNFLVEKYALVRTDQSGFSACTRPNMRFVSIKTPEQ
ncbi:TPA: hypothetical protein IR892_003230 [Escherichia coli]|nr:hypothetical protein [Escherichia coli]